MAAPLAYPVKVHVEDLSELQVERQAYAPTTPDTLAVPSRVCVAAGETTAARSAADDAALRSWFPHTYPLPIAALSVSDSPNAAGVATGAPLRVGVVFNGRQAPGANNVVTGAYVVRRATHCATCVCRGGGVLGGAGVGGAVGARELRVCAFCIRARIAISSPA